MSRLLVLQHLEREGPGLFCQIALERGLDVCIFRLDLGDCLPELEPGDLLLVLGGPMGIRDIKNPEYPWLNKEIDLLKEALEMNIAIIGVCLGAQLLAYASGGDIESLKFGSPLKPLPEIGWSNIFKASNAGPDDMIPFLHEPMAVLHWHADRILLSNSAQLLASSSRCAEQFFKIGQFAYGLQFHIEIEDKIINQWIDEDINFIKIALGEDAKNILKMQNNEFLQKTLSYRLRFLDALFDTLL